MRGGSRPDTAVDGARLHRWHGLAPHPSTKEKSMSKLLSVLVAAFFATGAFAQTHSTSPTSGSLAGAGSASVSLSTSGSASNATSANNNTNNNTSLNSNTNTNTTTNS